MAILIALPFAAAAIVIFINPRSMVNRLAAKFLTMRNSLGMRLYRDDDRELDSIVFGIRAAGAVLAVASLAFVVSYCVQQPSGWSR